MIKRKHVVVGVVLIAVILGLLIVKGLNAIEIEKIRIVLSGAKDMQIKCTYTADGIFNEIMKTLPTEFSIDAKELDFCVESPGESDTISAQVYVDGKKNAAAKNVKGQGIRVKVKGRNKFLPHSIKLKTFKINAK